MSDAPNGFTRDEDGILVQKPVNFDRHYSEPGEAIKTWWAGELRIGCNERMYGDYRSFPCGKKATHDPDANGNFTKCGTHCKAAKDKREIKRQARNAAWEAKWDRDRAISEAVKALEPALRKIAAGHNDARGLAEEVIAALDAARDK
jgi:hypothetical protein